MKDFKVTLKWDSPKLHIVTEIKALNVIEAFNKLKKDSVLPFEELSKISIKVIE
jgi:hypothetical protein